MAKLFYVIGASGAGKDSLMHYMRENIPTDAPLAFAHRYITRPANAGGENHIALSEQEFLLRLQQDCFVMDWFSHETYYGIGAEINQWLERGLDVVVNGSRAYLSEAACRYPNLVPVLIRVNPQVLRQRLRDRGRETGEQIEQRLNQAIQLEKQAQHPNLQIVENNGCLRDAGKHLLEVVIRHREEKCA